MNRLLVYGGITLMVAAALFWMIEPLFKPRGFNGWGILILLVIGFGMTVGGSPDNRNKKGSDDGSSTLS